ncbi:MAG: ABC transporter substrate-binding protein [Pseudomonadota bacterium]|nr:ABC transporter substrate-binding protein [Pseudomonadota bacterium]
MIGKDSFSIGKRKFLTGMVATGFAAAVPSVVLGANQRIVFANYGGSWEQAMRRAWIEPFTKKTGIRVISASGNTLGRLQAMVEARNVEWDLVEGTPELAGIGARKGLLEPLDFKIIDRSSMLDRPEFFADHMVPGIILGRVLVVNKKLGSVPPQWSSLFNVARFPGKRTFWNKVESGLLEIALLADGVAADKLYPLDLPRAFKKLDTIKEHILWFETVTQSEQFMRDGQAVMGVLADGRAQSVKMNGAPVEIMPEASILLWSVFVIPKGAPNKAAAMKFLAHVYTLQSQVAITREYNYGPIMPQAMDQIPADRLGLISGGPATKGKGVFLNTAWWDRNLERTTEQFLNWRLG